MTRLFIFFIVITGLLFMGIFIMIKPSIFVSSPLSNKNPLSDQSSHYRVIPKEIIVLGSVLTIVGLVGLSVLGFTIFKESREEKFR